MGQAIIKTKADSIANMLAKQKGITPSQFTNEFQQEWQSLLGGLGPDWSGSGKTNELTSIQQGILSQYKQIFNTLGQSEPSSPEMSSAVFTNVSQLASNAVYFSAQADQSGRQSSSNYTDILDIGVAAQSILPVASNQLAKAEAFLFAVRTNASNIDNLVKEYKANPDSSKQSAIMKEFSDLTNGVTQIVQSVSTVAITNLAPVNIILSKSTATLTDADLAQSYSSNATAFAQQATQAVNSAQLAAANLLKNATNAPNLNDASAQITALANLFAQVEQAAKNAERANQSIVIPLKQAADTTNKVSAVLVTTVKIEQTLDSLTNCVKIATQLSDGAQKEISGL